MKMKKRIMSMMLLTAMLLGCMTGCGTNFDNDESLATTDKLNSNATTVNTNTTTTVTTTATTTTQIVEEETDYSGAKEQIDAFYKYLETKEFGLITMDQTASWLYFFSYNDKENGGSYYENWNFYIIGKDSNKWIDCGPFDRIYDNEEGMPEYERCSRIGNGTFEIYAFYKNDEKGVYYYMTDEITIDETTLTEYKGKQVYQYNITELIGNDITLKTYQLDNES